MKAIEISEGIYRVGVNIRDKDYLFEGLWPIPTGVAINAYFVKGDKVALVDSWCTTDEYCPVGVNDLEKHPGSYERILESVGASPKDVAYVIVNHLEPDHSGWLGGFYKDYPEVQIICTEKAVPMLRDFYGITENIRAVKSGDTLDLGGGKEFVFYEAPNVHWPEVMVTFEKNSGTLFSIDAFGSYGAVEDNAIFDTDLSEEQLMYYQNETLRYYANIVASFSQPVLNALEALGPLPIKMIAPAHGLIWKGNPGRIVSLYAKLAGYAKNGGEKKVCLLWSSMYGNTGVAIDTVRAALKESGIEFSEHRIPDSPTGMVLADAWESKALIIAMPSYEYKMFPPMANLISYFKLKHFYHKKVLRMGSFGWVGGAEKDFQATVQGMHWDIMPSIEWPGRPTDDVLKKLKEDVKKLAASL
ncbi:MAG: FprA family A-type flavoprotein [Spirochaetia bacterium]